MNGTPEWQKERVRAYFDETTESSYLPNWGKESLAFHFGLGDESTASNEEALLNTNAYLAERASISPGERVLDAGCGVGGSAFWVAENCKAEVMGITLVPRQVEIARAIARERGLEERVRFECMDMVATSFPEASFDVVWSMESMCMVVDAEQFLREARRLLRAKGRFACTDLCRGDVPDEGIERQICDGWAMPPMRQPNVIVDLLKATGFDAVESVDLTGRAMRSARALKAAATNSLFVLRAEQAFMKKESRILEGHARAAIAMAEGLECGATAISHFIAYR
jgi:tocopherol O-methyltransferase